MLEKAAENVSFSSQSSLVLRVVGKTSELHPLSTASKQGNLSSECSSSSEEDDAADETLRGTTPPVVFDDEEAWESCSQSSISNTSSLTSSIEEPGYPLVASTPPVKVNLPPSYDTDVREQDQKLHSPSRENRVGQDGKINSEANRLIELPQQTVVASVSSPPTSNLIKKLFPALGSEKNTAVVSSVSREKGNVSF